ncbi:MAG: hypothetical protein WCB27_21140 [Thermoguttaceae bacterium]
MKTLSIVGKDYYTDKHVVGYYNLIFHGTPQKAERAKDRLDNTKATETMVHAESVAVGV